MSQRQVWISDALREGLLTPDALTRARAEHEQLQRQGQQVTLPALLRARYVDPAARSRFESLVREATRQRTAVVPAPSGSRPSGSAPPPGEAATVTHPGSRPQGPSPESETRPRAAPRPSAQPTSLGRYEIAEEIARGGMGVVYRAHDPQLGRDVAVKLLLDDSPTRRKRFQVEARAISRLEHPNVIPIHEVGESPDGQPYLVMKLLSGGTLEDRLEADGPRPPHEAARTIQLLAQALHYAHDHMILHRDVKPANVLLGEDGAPVLTDFGLAKLIDSEASGATRSGVMLGTPSYMPPEQATGKFVDWRADVYALGATLYALLTGEPPFTAETTIELMVQIAAREPARPSSLRTGLPFELDTICLKCLEKDPADRYPSAYALALDLGRFLEHQPIHAAPPSLLARVKKWRRRNTVLVRVGGVAAGLVFAISLGAAAWASHARAAEREAAVADARQRALTHAKELDALSRSDGVGDDAPARRVGKALTALQASQAWSALAPNDPAARQTHFDAALTLGDAAKAREQWVLAGEAYRNATALGIDDTRARELAAEAEVTATRIAHERAAEVEGWLDRLAAGDLHRVQQGLLEAEFAIVRYADDQTVELLAGRLDEVSDRLLEAAAAVFRELAKANAHERAAGEEDLADCELALRLRALPPWDERDFQDVERAEAFVQAAYRRAMDRAAREAPRSPTAFAGKAIVDQRIATRVGHGPLELARVCANVLGRIGAHDADRFVGVEPEPILFSSPDSVGEGHPNVVLESDSASDGPPTSAGHPEPSFASDGLLPANTDEARSRAEEALLRYLFAETDPERALFPAMALIRLDPNRSQRPFRQWQQRSPSFRRELRSFANNFRPRAQPAEGVSETDLGWGGAEALVTTEPRAESEPDASQPLRKRQSPEADEREEGLTSPAPAKAPEPERRRAR